MAVMVRAEITEQEWVDLRKRALDLNTPVQRIVGGLITDYLQSNGADAHITKKSAPTPKQDGG